jgi:hypothetical protein
MTAIDHPRIPERSAEQEKAEHRADDTSKPADSEKES